MRISDWSSDVCSSDLPASRAETIGKMMGAPKALASLARYLQQRDVRIVHTNEGPMHVTWGPAARLAGRKLLWHHRSSPRAKGLRFLAPPLAHRVASVSRFAAPRPGGFSAAGRSEERRGGEGGGS